MAKQKYESKYTPKQRQDFHNRMSKKGSFKIDQYTGEKKPLSDFERGVHHQKAQQIFNARKNKKLNSDNELRNQSMMSQNN